MKELPTFKLRRIQYPHSTSETDNPSNPFLPTFNNYVNVELVRKQLNEMNDVQSNIPEEAVSQNVGNLQNKT